MTFTVTAIEQDPPCSGGETDDGELHRDLRLVDACSPHPGVFAGPLAPATHPRDSVVVIAPSRATFLWLKYLETSWRWPVRAPV